MPRAPTFMVFRQLLLRHDRSSDHHLIRVMAIVMVAIAVGVADVTVMLIMSVEFWGWESPAILIAIT